MIRNTFLIFNNIGEKRERRYWLNGILEWEQLMNVATGALLRKEIEMAYFHWKMRDLPFFFRKLPPTSRWRLLNDFQDQIAFIDIECAVSYSSRKLMLVGIYFRGKYTALLRGKNLFRSAFLDAVGQASLLCTFNGDRYDLPLLRMEGLIAEEEYCSLDIMSVARHAGYAGGLKKVEANVGVKRQLFTRLSAEGMTGYLWRRWEKGSRAALNLLMKYNEEDTRNLRPLSMKLYENMRRKCLEHIGV